MSISFPDYREFDFDDPAESRVFVDRYVDEITNVFAEDKRLGEEEYDGPTNHCDECGREYRWRCIGPVRYGFMFICTDCKREMFKTLHGIRDIDLGIRSDEDED